METSYGALKDKWDGIRSLSTLAFAKYRDPYFRNELLIALRIIQDGHISREKFVSSWAGAMGQTQFMPTNFVDYAVDFNGDGRRDIWTNVPDVLASTANYFAKAAGGWKMGMPWGFEVLVPKGFDLIRAARRSTSGASLAYGAPTAKPFHPRATASCFFRPACPAPPSSSRRTSRSSKTTTTPMFTRSPSVISPT
jgi:membrane-bound lytic murein transglycosylase B